MFENNREKIKMIWEKLKGRRETESNPAQQKSSTKCIQAGSKVQIGFPSITELLLPNAQRGKAIQKIKDIFIREAQRLSSADRRKKRLKRTARRIRRKDPKFEFANQQGEKTGSFVTGQQINRTVVTGHGTFFGYIKTSEESFLTKDAKQAEHHVF